MKIFTIAFLMLILINFTASYTFCEDGNVGVAKILSVTDDLEDNFKIWEWSDGQDINIVVDVENNLNESYEFTTEIIFLDNEDNVQLVRDKDDLIKTRNIDDNDNEEINFNFEMKTNLPYHNYNYDMLIKTYITGNESHQCQQHKRTIKVNGFDSCSDNTDLNISKITISGDYVWKLDKNQSVHFNVSSSLPKETYDIEIVFYNKDSTEVDLVENDNDLIRTETFANGTYSFDFDFELRAGLPEGNYGVYAKIISEDGDDCAENRLYKNYAKGKSTLQNYQPISVKDTPGIIFTNITGPTNITAGSKVTYKIDLKNTGVNEPMVKVYIYNSVLGIKETKVIADFKKDTKRTIEIPVVVSDRVGKFTLGFFADYEYVNDSGYHDDTTQHKHDILKKITIIAAPVKKIIPVPSAVVTAPVVSTPNPVLEKQQYSTWSIVIALSIILIAIIIGWVLYKKYREPSVSQRVR